MNNIIVCKISGKLILDNPKIGSLVKAIKTLVAKQKKLIIVHGGGPQLDNLQEKLGIKIKKINGLRITDKVTLKLAKMIYKGTINSDLVSIFIKNNLNAVGLSGIDGKLVLADKRPVISVKDQESDQVKNVDFGFVGDIKQINIKILQVMLKNNFIPIIASLGVDSNGQVLNINADSIAAKIAVCFKAEKLILVTDVPGIIIEKKIISTISKEQVDAMIQQKKITGGMIPKVQNALNVLENGVKMVQIVGNLTSENDWLNAILQNKYGTIVVN